MLIEQAELSNKIINGKAIATQILTNLKITARKIKQRHNFIPTLAIILVGNNPASVIYVRNKIKAAEEISINAKKIELPEHITTKEILELIKQLNEDPYISGIIIQLPLPISIDKNLLLSAISPNKDVDGFHPLNVGYLHNNSSEAFIPCTALGCLELIKTVKPVLSGENVTIISRSNIVGKPLSALLINNSCTVTICHSKTQNLPFFTQNSDIVISAIGIGRFLGPEYFKQDSIIIDVGISKIPNTNQIAGDVDFEKVLKKVRHITPVPGGVGPMTVAFLLSNTIKASLLQLR